MNREDKEYIQSVADNVIATLFDTDLTQEGMEFVLDGVKQAVQFAFIMGEEQ